MSGLTSRLGLVLSLTACHPENAAVPGRFALPRAARVDVAIGARDPDGVLIYFDVMNRPSDKPPDAYLDGPHSRVSDPAGLEIANNRLYVANRGANTITVYPDFAHLTDEQPPDTVLDLDRSLVEAPTDLHVFDDDLYVGQDADRVLIFQDVSSLASSDPPEVVLDTLGSRIDHGFALAVSNAGLFVANHGAHTVTVYASPSTLTSFAPPSREISLPSANGAGPTHLALADDTLIVTLRLASEVLAFPATGGPSSGNSPLWTLGSTAGLSQPSGVVLTGGSLAVGNETGSAGLLVFQGTPPVDGVAVGAGSRAPLIEVDDVACAGEVLFCTSAATDSLHAFRFPTRLTSAARPDVTLRDARMDHPVALRAIVAPATVTNSTPDAAPDLPH